MRVSLAIGALIVSTLLALAGCTNPFNQFTSKSKSAAPPKTALTNAPAPPSFGTQSTLPPAVTMPNTAAAQPPNTSSGYPAYPGTNYPVTPYGTQSLAAGAAPNAPGNPALGNAPASNPAYAQPQGAPGGAYAPPSVASNPNTQPVNPNTQPVNPLAGQYPPSTASQYPASATPQYPAYNGSSPPAGPYSAGNPAAVNR